MTKSGMEKLFKTVFAAAVIIGIFFVIGIFLLIIKIMLLFAPELHIMGLTIVQ